MNNIFLEGPIQTGKSTFIRKVLKETFGPNLNGVSGFTSQRLTDPDGNLLGFRLAPAASELSIVADLPAIDNVFKRFTPDGPVVDMGVFETAGIRYMDEALTKARTGLTRVILLDEIGGHELKSEVFRNRLYELLESEFPCVGVIKSPDNTRRIEPALLDLNAALHEHLSATTDFAEFEASLQAIL